MCRHYGDLSLPSLHIKSQIVTGAFLWNAFKNK